MSFKCPPIHESHTIILKLKKPHKLCWVWINVDNFMKAFLICIAQSLYVCVPQNHSSLVPCLTAAMWGLSGDTRRGQVCLMRYSVLRCLVFMKASLLSFLEVLFSSPCDVTDVECSCRACSHQCNLLYRGISTLVPNSLLLLLWLLL